MEIDFVRFIEILGYEVLQNLAPLVGFAIAGRAWRHERRWRAVAVIVLCCIVGALTLEFSEPLLTRQPANHNRFVLSVVVNSLVFIIGSLIGMLVMAREPKAWALVALGLGCAAVLTLSQTAVHNLSLATAVVHIVALSAGFAAYLLGLKWAMAARTDLVAGLRSFLLVVVGAVAIIVCDYWRHIVV